MSRRVCPHPQCSAVVPVDRFACRTHWFHLPLPIRDEIWRTYRRGDKQAWVAAAMAASRHWAAQIKDQKK